MGAPSGPPWAAAAPPVCRLQPLLDLKVGSSMRSHFNHYCVTPCSPGLRWLQVSPQPVLKPPWDKGGPPLGAPLKAHPPSSAGLHTEGGILVLQAGLPWPGLPPERTPQCSCLDRALQRKNPGRNADSCKTKEASARLHSDAAELLAYAEGLGGR